MQRLMRIPEYNTLWYAEIARATQLAEAENWLDTEIIRNVQLIDTAMKEDVYKPVLEQQLRRRSRRDAVVCARACDVREVRARAGRQGVRRIRQAIGPSGHQEKQRAGISPGPSSSSASYKLTGRPAGPQAV